MVKYKRRAILKPVRTDDLQNNSALAMGREIKVTFAWVIESGDYEGQDAYMSTGEFIGWMPECDLEFLD